MKYLREASSHLVSKIIKQKLGEQFLKIEIRWDCSIGKNSRVAAEKSLSVYFDLLFLLLMSKALSENGPP